MGCNLCLNIQTKKIKINLRLVNCPIHIESCPRFSQIVVGWDIKKIVVSTLWMDVSAINCIDAQKEIHKWLSASVVHIDKLMQTHQHFHSFSRGSFFMRELNSCTILFAQLHFFSSSSSTEYLFQFHGLFLNCLGIEFKQNREKIEKCYAFVL